jgi:hypothetical protein
VPIRKVPLKAQSKDDRDEQKTRQVPYDVQPAGFADRYRPLNAIMRPVNSLLFQED